MIDDSLAPLQVALETTLGLTYDQARSMPDMFYTDPRVLALEREQLFMREWICVGRRPPPAISWPSGYAMNPWWSSMGGMA